MAVSAPPPRDADGSYGPWIFVRRRQNGRKGRDANPRRGRPANAAPRPAYAAAKSSPVGAGSLLSNGPNAVNKVSPPPVQAAALLQIEPPPHSNLILALEASGNGKNLSNLQFMKESRMAIQEPSIPLLLHGPISADLLGRKRRKNDSDNFEDEDDDGGVASPMMDQ